jgi:hypothetical protein
MADRVQLECMRDNYRGDLVGISEERRLLRRDV